MSWKPSCLLHRSQTDLTPRRIILWWELRRVVFNGVVGFTGVVTCAIAVIAGLIVESRGGQALFPDGGIFVLLGIVLYGVMANICYTAGWVFELIAHKWWPAEASAFGRLSFLFGIGASVVLTLLPAILIVGGSIIELLAHHRAPG
jgi:hypothetical protein